MAVPIKAQRIRDPLHNLIEFGTKEFERTMWRVIQTPQFQRLRRIKQLGFSDLTYPGATHTRFAHSIGVFHTARRLMEIIERHAGDDYSSQQARKAMAAALVHDLGHGMFSHAFEEVGKALNLKMARHEIVSDQLIRDGEVGQILMDLGSGFANDVADVIQRGGPGNLYDAVVSSQFDADRLDYMQRDRLMTGMQNSGIDFTWLISNLEIGAVPSGVDDEEVDHVATFVLGPKATHAAETYVLSLFHLYPTVYFHKTTRGAEKMFSALMLRLIHLAKDDHIDKTGLPHGHPIVRFAKGADSLENALALDDTVFWGALSLMVDATDPGVCRFAKRLLGRRLLKCIDIRERLAAEQKAGSPKSAGDEAEANMRMERRVDRILERLKAWSAENSKEIPRILIDRTERDPYKHFQESKGPLNQIRIRGTNNRILDMAEISHVVAGIKTFYVFRAYVDKKDHVAISQIDTAINDVLRSDVNAD